MRGITASDRPDNIRLSATVTGQSAVRAQEDFSVGAKIAIFVKFEVFNLTNSRNVRDPTAKNLLFNFDGTVQTGLGDPRQAQFGVRVLF